MRKSYLLVAAALLVAASCQKNDNASSGEGIKYNPVDVVLSAAIEGVDTKVSYTEDANVLKAAWKAGDKISLVAIDADGKALVSHGIHPSSLKYRIRIADSHSLALVIFKGIFTILLDEYLLSGSRVYSRRAHCIDVIL